MNDRPIFEIIQENEIHISSSIGGGYIAKSKSKDIILKAKTLEKLLVMIRKVYG